MPPKNRRDRAEQDANVAMLRGYQAEIDAERATPALIVPSDTVRNALNQRTAESLRDLLRQAGQDAERQANELKLTIDQLTRHLTRVSATLETDRWQASVNSLGEIQGQGLEIDRRCALLNAAQESYRAIERAVPSWQPAYKATTPVPRKR